MSYVVGVALLMAVAGCSEDPPDPPPTSTPTPSASASVSPTPVPVPTLPASATPDQKGAEVFVRYFWDVFNYTYASGDTKPLKSISDSGCRFCLDVVKHVDDLGRKQEVSRGAEVEIEKVLAVPPGVAQGAIVTLRFDQEKGSVLAADGSTVESSEAITDGVAEMVVQHQSSWQMMGVTISDPKGQS